MKKIILVLNDEQCIRDLVVLVLIKAGFECVEAADDAKALEILHSRPVSLLIQDMKRDGTDGCDGREFVRTLRSDPKLRRTPVLFLSGNTERGARNIFSEAGMDFDKNVAGYIMLPFDPKDLLAKVEAILLRQDESAANP